MREEEVNHLAECDYSLNKYYRLAIKFVKSINERIPQSTVSDEKVIMIN